jgi:hypothetical protein
MRVLQQVEIIVLQILISGITLNQGIDATNYNFSEKPSAVLGDTVYFDKNADGIQQPASGEYGLSGVPVTITCGGIRRNDWWW